MKKYFVFVIVVVTMVFAACGDYLDQVPEKDVETFESIFERKSCLLYTSPSPRDCS